MVRPLTSKLEGSDGTSDNENGHNMRQCVICSRSKGVQLSPGHAQAVSTGGNCKNSLRDQTFLKLYLENILHFTKIA